jgi:hypothetical protein
VRDNYRIEQRVEMAGEAFRHSPFAIRRSPFAVRQKLAPGVEHAFGAECTVSNSRPELKKDACVIASGERRRANGEWQMAMREPLQSFQ